MPTVRTLVSSATKVTRLLPRWGVVAGDRFTIAFCSLGIISTVLGLTLSKLEPTIFLFVGVATTVAVLASLWFRRPSLVWPWVCIGLAFVLFLVGGVTRSASRPLETSPRPGRFLPTWLPCPDTCSSRRASWASHAAEHEAPPKRASYWTASSPPLLSLLSPGPLSRSPSSRAREVPIVTKIVLTAYPSMSIFLVVVTLRIVFNPGGRAPARILALCRRHDPHVRG